MGGGRLCGGSHLHISLRFVVPLGTAQLCSPDEGHMLETQCLTRWTFGARTAAPMYSFKFHRFF